MLHAEIRWAQSALHLLGEVDGYNLRTLRQHLGQALRETGTVRVSIDLSPQDLPRFVRQTGYWLPQLEQHGAVVALNVHAAGPEPAVH
ncbi:MAG: hypothetical protein HY270_22280 [Deltaproteobacteria bacterium]|nr:hypothetical protein [Deltaproteobacteria bacterium]